MIDLFEHNRTAYDSAVSLLSETGKAAVIHPTGTGKSFIGFKLSEDHPDKVICWLSPSEYIFRTQLENLAKVSDGWQPENIRFYTYARLMNLAEEELADIHPDYIVLDEFHRCGAQEWGKGVTALLDLYADIPILGLSATNIRYLDNQRDMADELFDGNIASEMTLGDAIVRGILAAPKYVISIYSYQKELEKYKERVRYAQNKAVRDEAERYLDALRRTLEKAEGLDTVFAKHMTERTGKYIVFCANFEHIIMLLKKWEQLPPEMQTEEVRKYYDILKKKQVSLFFKRMFDVMVSFLMLILLSPLFLFLAIAIKLDSKGPVFYRQDRVTQYGRRFRIHKFRTMVQNADKGSQVTVSNDSRITRVGKVIRNCRLDEIAQLIDVIQGTVTLVGVRPESTKYVAAYTPEMMATLLLPAGVTSLASILYKDEAKLLDATDDTDKVYIEKILPAKMYYNLKSIENFSFWGDIRIMFMTFFAMCGKKYKGDYAEKQEQYETIER